MPKDADAEESQDGKNEEQKAEPKDFNDGDFFGRHCCRRFRGFFR